MLNLDLRILIEKNIKFSSFQRPKIHKFANNEYKKAINSGLNNDEANKVALDSTIAHFKNNIKYCPGYGVHSDPSLTDGRPFAAGPPARPERYPPSGDAASACAVPCVPASGPALRGRHR